MEVDSSNPTTPPVLPSEPVESVEIVDARPQQPAPADAAPIVPRLAKDADMGGITEDEIEQFVSNILQRLQERLADGFDVADAAWILNRVIEAMENLADYEISEEQAKAVAMHLFERALDEALKSYNDADAAEIKKLAVTMADLLIETIDLLGIDEAVKESGQRFKDWWKARFAGCGNRA